MTVPALTSCPTCHHPLDRWGCTADRAHTNDPDRPADPWNLLDSDVARLRRTLTEQVDRGRTVLPLDPEPDPEPTVPPVPYLHVPADGTCGYPPPARWRATTLRQVLPAALGVTQCALTPGHDGSPHVGLVFVPTGPDRPALTEQVAFPADVT